MLFLGEMHYLFEKTFRLITSPIILLSAIKMSRDTLVYHVWDVLM